jgi:hypothetical protein
VLTATGFEVGGQVLVGIAVLVGADHPDLLAPQLVAQRLERPDLIDAAHHPPPTGNVLERQRGPVTQHALVVGTSSPAG